MVGKFITECYMNRVNENIRKRIGRAVWVSASQKVIKSSLNWGSELYDKIFFGDVF